VQSTVPTDLGRGWRLLFTNLQEVKRVKWTALINQDNWNSGLETDLQFTLCVRYGRFLVRIIIEHNSLHACIHSCMLGVD